ncbi:transcription factor IIA, alpha/beta subunit-domain-containing protein [Cladochytrium replicatum]|nr:transcription factor IIA, alpha/beta subunit-domain-containing protein [Cladochytrium replicatum]
MSNAQVPHIYKAVIEDVIRKCAEEFVRLGFDEAVLQDLKQTWEAKLIATKVAPFEGVFDTESFAAASAGAGAIVGDPTAALLHVGLGATSGLGPVVGVPSADDYYGEGGGAYGYHQGAFQISQTDGQYDRPSNFIGSGPIQDADDGLLPSNASREEIDRRLEEALSQSISNNGASSGGLPNWKRRVRKGRRIGQVDGKLDDDDDDDEDEKSDGDDGGINSDLDDDDSEDDEAEAEHFILCQYEKVGRIKNKWKCALKDGIVHVNGKDYLFSKANCDFEW